LRYYFTKNKKLPGTRYEDVFKKAFSVYTKIKKRSKRRPYVRSAYFGKDKVFLSMFWEHMYKKNWRDRTRRAHYFVCAIELLQNSRVEPLVTKMVAISFSEIRKRPSAKCGTKTTAESL